MGHAEFTLHNAPHAAPISLDEYWMPFTPNRDFKAEPKMAVRAEGMYYWNERGDKIIDASSGLFCVNAGFEFSLGNFPGSPGVPLRD